MDNERQKVADTAAAIGTRSVGRTGNHSIRSGDRIAIKPTGIPYNEIGPEDVAVVELDGTHVDGLDPSSETPMHLAIYRALDATAIVHTHSTWATTLAVLHQPVPPVHYAVAAAGGEVPVADYATYGTKELAANVVETLEAAGTTACLLANHGLIAIGDTLSAALETADHVEFTAQLYCHAKPLGDPSMLAPDEIDRVARKFASYGQPSE